MELDGIDMKKKSVNFVFVTADRYATLALRSSSQVKMGKSQNRFLDDPAIYTYSDGFHPRSFRFMAAAIPQL